jgi:HAD superfamily hydrolase (TIGR01509 family)
MRLATGHVVATFAASLGDSAGAIDPETATDEIWQFDGPVPAGEGTPFEARLAGFLNMHLGVSLRTTDMRPLADAVCATWEHSHEPDPGAAQTLAHLAQLFPLGLASNFDHPPHVHRRISERGLAKHFGTIVISGEVGVKKPDPEILRIACRNLEVAPDGCVYVGDSIVDCRAALDGGLSFVWVRRPAHPGFVEAPDAELYRETDMEMEEMARTGRISTIATIGELPALLDK